MKEEIEYNENSCYLKNELKLKGVTQKQMQDDLGVSQQYVSSILNNKTSIGKKMAKKLSELYGLDEAIILTGQPTTITSVDITKHNELPTDDTHVPLLPISAQGGALSDFADSVREIDCEKILSPIKGVDFAMTISGDSMAPEYPSGAQILIKRINERAFIDWGKVYVLDTCNGSIIKKVYPGNTENKVKCVSINADYPPFEVSFKDIFGMYRVLLCMSLK